MWCRLFGHKYVMSRKVRYLGTRLQLRYKCKRCGGVKYE